ncbi:MAG: hypothetical protein ACKPJ4_02940, partial [Dolichospermum sp.]
VKISKNLKQHSPEKDREEKLMNEVLVLIKTLVYNEEITIKLLIDCLYDIGITNLINQKFQLGTLNKTLKFMTKISKPAVKIFAWKWVKNNCPQLITAWLKSKVTFPQEEALKIEVVVENEPENIAASSQTIDQNQVKRLNFQVKLLISLLIAVLTIFTGSSIWLLVALQQSHVQTVEKLQNQVKTLKSSLNQH